MRALGFIAAGIAFAFAGCSLFVSLDGLGTSDAGTEAGTEDARDVGMPDVSPPPDAGPDVYDFVCPDASIVCDDFDDAPLGMRWTSSSVMGATMAIDDGGSFSPPNSLLVSMPDNPNSNDRNAYLAKTFTSRATIDCDFDVKVDMTTAMMTMYDVRPIEFDINANGYDYYEFWLNLSPMDLTFEQDLRPSTPDAGSKNPTTTVMTPLVASQWHHIHLFTDFKRAKIEVDAVLAYDKALVNPIGASSGTIHFGLAYDAEPPSWSYRVDDVYCR